MCTHPDLTGQLAREHHRQLLAAASRRRQGCQATGNANAVTIIGRAATAIAGAALATVRSSTTGHHVAAGDSVASGQPRATAAMPGWPTD